MSEIKRNALKSVAYLLERFPIVAILGARQVGKSTLLRMLYPNARHFDLEVEKYFAAVERDVTFFLSQQKPPVTFDEAQLSPKLMQGLRVAVDQARNQAGQYLLSGSSSPELLQHISETLAGRIAIYELAGLSINEAFNKPLSDFYARIQHADIHQLLELPVQVNQSQLLDLCYHGGYPEHFIHRQDSIFHDQWLDNYFRTYIERDIRALFPNLQLDTYRRFIRMLAVNSSQLINASQFAKALDVSQPTIKSYLNIAKGTFLWRQIPGFHKNLGKRLVKMPKGQLRDSGLLCRLLNISSVDSLFNHPQFGHIWESFIIENLINGLQTQLRSFNYYFYRTHHQAEVDLVLDGHFGLIPIEIKTGQHIRNSSIRALSNFINDYQCRYGIVIHNGEQPELLTDNIIAIPAGCL